MTWDSVSSIKALLIPPEVAISILGVKRPSRVLGRIRPKDLFRLLKTIPGVLGIFKYLKGLAIFAQFLYSILFSCVKNCYYIPHFFCCLNLELEIAIHEKNGFLNTR